MNAILKDSLWASWVVAMALAFAVALSPARAFGTGGELFEYGQGKDLQKILDLSEEQVEQLHALHFRKHVSMQKARQEMIDARRQFRVIAKKAEDEKAVREAFKTVASAMENMEVLRGKDGAGASINIDRRAVCKVSRPSYNNDPEAGQGRAGQIPGLSYRRPERSC